MKSLLFFVFFSSIFKDFLVPDPMYYPQLLIILSKIIALWAASVFAWMNWYIC